MELCARKNILKIMLGVNEKPFLTNSLLSFPDVIPSNKYECFIKIAVKIFYALLCLTIKAARVSMDSSTSRAWF